MSWTFNKYIMCLPASVWRCMGRARLFFPLVGYTNLPSMELGVAIKSTSSDGFSSLRSCPENLPGMKWCVLHRSPVRWSVWPRSRRRGGRLGTAGCR